MTNFANREYYSVVAEVSPSGSAMRLNTINHKSFGALNKLFDDHLKTRLLVVTITGQHGFYVIDLWQTDVSPDYPYVTPAWVGEDRERRVFDDLDLAIGWCAFSIDTIDETTSVRRS